MKKTIYLISILAGVLFLAQSLYVKAEASTEKYAYKVVKTYENFEVRKYKATLFTSVKLGTSDYRQASSQGFSILAGYIFGGNETREKIAMTSPVAMSLGDSMEVMFMVPKKHTKATLPKPNSSSIEIKEEPEKTVAAIGFGGYANAEKIENYKSQLIEALEKEGIKHTSNFFFLGYNSPYETTNRLNEVIVELTE
ncbi:MAG: heme-binding protein [Flavobacteriales bacterium]